LLLNHATKEETIMKAVRENYQTAGQPYQPNESKSRKLPMWIIIPLAIAAVLIAVLWGGGYLVTF
jgi:hypothetical protein